MNPTLRRALWIAAGGLVAMLITVRPVENDTHWWQLAMGSYIAHHGIPSHDPFTYLATTGWTPHEWLYDYLLYAVWSAVGNGGLVLGFGVLGALALVIATGATRAAAATVGPWAAACVAACAGLAYEAEGVRTATVSVLLLAITLWLLSRWREGGHERLLWLLPPLFVLWANLADGCLEGLAVVGVTALLPRRANWGIAGRRGPLAVVALLCAIGVTVSPMGPGIYSFVAGYIIGPGNQVVTGWTSPTFHDTIYRLLEISLIGLVTAWCLTEGGPDWCDVVWLALLLAIALWAQGTMALLMVGLVPQLGRYVQAAWLRHRHRIRVTLAAPRIHSRGAALATATLLLAGCGGAVGWRVSSTVATAARDAAAGFGWPEAAVGYVMRTHPSQPVFTVAGQGGYVAYALGPRQLTGMDGEVTDLTNADITQYQDIHQLMAIWPEELAALHVRLAVLPASDQDVGALYELGWRVDCYDSGAHSVVMSGPPAPIAQGPAGTTLKPSAAPACSP